jgi:excisionase family DNA binding protein
VSLDLLTTEQVAQILKVKDRKTVRKLVKSGKLRRVIMGERSVRFRPEDVAEQ